jgi:two-component system chemotaxis response regulator CheB
MTATEGRRLRVLVVDDSAYNRQAITQSFVASGEIDVVGMAADGNEALRMVYELRPDVIALDLEMPRMDGFSFLRVLMGSRPTPVIVVSSYSGKENVFRALELGAVDFVAKPESSSAEGLKEGFEPLLQKVLLFRTTQPERVNVRPSVAPTIGRREMPTLVEKPRNSPRYLVGIVASTGGPSSLGLLFSQLSMRGNFGVLVAQHMPERFTRTFAERLNRKSVFDVKEAQHADAIWTQTGFVCPGRQCMEVEVTANSRYRLRLRAPQADDRYIPRAAALRSLYRAR